MTANMNKSITQDEATRYSRHLLLLEIGMEGQKRLTDSSVLIIGIGGLGSSASLHLAAAGVGRIGLVDPDVVDLSNLQRQIVHDSQNLGKPKVDSAGKRLSSLNPLIQVDAFHSGFTPSSADEIANGFDILLDCTDNLSSRYLVNDYCVLAKKPDVYGTVFRFEGQVSIFDARHGPCYRCLFPSPPPDEMVPPGSATGIFGPLPGVIGTLMAVEAIKLILGIGNPLIGHLLVYDAMGTTFQNVDVHKNKDCPICGKSPKIKKLEGNF